LVDIAPAAAVVAFSTKSTVVLAEHFGVKAVFTNSGVEAGLTAVPLPAVPVQTLAAIEADETTHNDIAIISFFI